MHAHGAPARSYSQLFAAIRSYLRSILAAFIGSQHGPEQLIGPRQRTGLEVRYEGGFRSGIAYAQAVASPPLPARHSQSNRRPALATAVKLTEEVCTPTGP